MRKLSVVAVSALLSVFGLLGGPASATPCDPGDPNCHIGCEITNNTPIVNKHVSCQT